MAAKLIKTSAPGVYKRGERFTFWFRNAEGKMRWATVNSFEDAVEYRRRNIERARESTTPGEWRYDPNGRYLWLAGPMEVRPYHPRAEPGEPAWKCGHPKTPENTHGPYPSHKGQCAICWRWARRRADLKWRDTMTSHRALNYRWTQDCWRRRKRRERLQEQLRELRATREAFIASLDGPEADAARAAFAAVDSARSGS
jgi:hypothetical protein